MREQATSPRGRGKPQKKHRKKNPLSHRRGEAGKTMKSTTTTTTLQNVAMYNDAGAFIGFGVLFRAGNLETIIPSDALPYGVCLDDIAQLAESYGTDVVIYATPAANPASWRGVGPEPRSLETILDNLQFRPKLTPEQVDELAQELASLVLEK